MPAGLLSVRIADPVDCGFFLGSVALVRVSLPLKANRFSLRAQRELTLRGISRHVETTRLQGQHFDVLGLERNLNR
jgi:hypothetical protein